MQCVLKSEVAYSVTLRNAILFCGTRVISCLITSLGWMQRQKGDELSQAKLQQGFIQKGEGALGFPP